MKPPIMIMGIMASGKSRIGAQIAALRGGQFIECDDWHPDANVKKMTAGIPLTDEDRAPWLDRLATEVAAAAQSGRQVVFSCSALKRAYRERLRSGLPGLVTICLTLDADTAARRASGRADHFMPNALVDSQLATFELPQEETRTLVVDAAQPFERVLEEVDIALRSFDATGVLAAGG